jgi:hypothetical protein
MEKTYGKNMGCRNYQYIENDAKKFVTFLIEIHGLVLILKQFSTYSWYTHEKWHHIKLFSIYVTLIFVTKNNLVCNLISSYENPIHLSH